MIVLAVTALLLAASIPLIAQLRTFEADRAAGRRTLVTRMGPTAVRVVYSILVVIAYALLPLAWALEAIPLGGLAPLLTAPLAVRLGDVVSHRSGEALRGALREGVVLLVAFAALLAAGVYLSP